jgi:riboflavin synthase
MFTGIVQELGEVAVIKRHGDAARLTIRGSTQDVELGESIAVNGVCLTVAEILDGTFTADVMGETLNRSGLGQLTEGAPVNLERSVRLADRMGGHLVQGHVDATALIVSRKPAGHWDQVRIGLPRSISRYVVEKGSIAVDGVSLTVSALSPPGAADAPSPPGAADAPPGAADAPSPPGAVDAPNPAEQWFEVSLIPETLKRTTLGTRKPGDTVNLEVDVIAKHVERLLIERNAEGAR